MKIMCDLSSHAVLRPLMLFDAGLERKAPPKQAGCQNETTLRISVGDDSRSSVRKAETIVAIFYPFSQFCEIDIALLSS